MKKLLIDVNPVVPYYIDGKVSGIGRTTLELVEALSELKDLPFKIKLYSQNMKGIGSRNMKTRFKTHHLYLRDKENINKLLARIPVKEFLFPYDLLHITSNFAYVRNSEKCIVTLHDALFMKISEKAFGHTKMRSEVPPFIQRCKHVITCSEYSKKDIMETMNVPSEKISVIYWGIRHELFYPKRTTPERPYFLSVSCNAERKRTDVLIDSFLNYCDEYPRSSCELLLVWGNPPYECLEKISRHPAKNRIHFLSNISDKKLAELYNGATALFFPSSYEGFGLPILEGMACGTPVVTCKNSSLEEIGQDCVVYAEEKELQQNLAFIMGQLEKKELDLTLMINKGIERANLFQWSATAQKYAELYEQLLKQS